MTNPVKICVKPELLSLEGIKQYFVAVQNDDQKYDTLKDLYQFINLSQTIIFCNSVQRVIDLYNALNNDNFPVCSIHSNMSSYERTQTITEFKSGKFRMLISSNILSRGFDTQQIGFVINFDLCNDVHTYLHRIGRSGRYGRKGISVNFITKKDVPIIRNIEKYYSIQIDELPNNFSL
jgi:superfamily II DNA/RNA helicase